MEAAIAIVSVVCLAGNIATLFYVNRAVNQILEIADSILQDEEEVDDAET